MNFDDILQKISGYFPSDMSASTYQIIVICLFVMFIILVLLNFLKKRKIINYETDLDKHNIKLNSAYYNLKSTRADLDYANEKIKNSATELNKYKKEYEDLLEKFNAISSENDEYKNKEAQRQENLKSFKEKLEEKEKQAELEKSYIYKIGLINHNVQAKPLLNNKEKYIYNYLANEKINQNFVIFTQVALNAFLKSANESSAWKAYSLLRADFVFCLKKSLTPVLVFEYNGSGHYYNADEKDEIKHKDMTKQKAVETAEIKFLCLENIEDNEEIIKEFLDNTLIKELDEIKSKYCPKCESLLIEKEGKNGKFLGCSNFPKCRFTKSLQVSE